MAQQQERVKPQKEIDITLDEIYQLMLWAMDHRDEPMYRVMAESLHVRLLSVWKYHYDRCADPGSFTLRLKR